MRHSTSRYTKKKVQYLYIYFFLNIMLFNWYFNEIAKQKQLKTIDKFLKTKITLYKI